MRAFARIARPRLDACAPVQRQSRRLLLTTRRTPRLRTPRLGQTRWCSNEEKKPPQGFEKFYKKGGEAKSGESSAKPAEASEGKKPAEKPTGSTAEGAEAESNGQAKEGPSEGKKAEGGASASAQGFQAAMQRSPALGLGVGAFLLYLSATRGEQVPTITVQEMMKEYLIKGHVEKIQIVNKEVCRVKLRDDAPLPVTGSRTFSIQLGTQPEAFEAKMENLQHELGLSALDYVPIEYVNEVNVMQDYVAPYLPQIMFLIPLLLFLRAMSGGMGGPSGMSGMGGRGGRNIFSMGKAFPGGNQSTKSKVRFTDVAGLEGAKKEVVEFVDFLKYPDKYTKLGARVPKGGLLVGPPGTGKTLLAKAVAGEAEVPFYSMSGSDFVEMFVGVGPSRVRDLFKQARDNAPSIIFIDEIDAVGRKRGRGSMGGNDERENTLNQMLVEMDGFAPSTGVVVLAGTNRADILDNALTRPGRFDRQIAIDKPDLSERESIYMVHLKPVQLSEKLSPDSVAKRMAALTPGFAGSDIANVCNEAAIFAARRNSSCVEMEDFELACERVIGGLPKQNSLMSKEEKKTVAIHEAGHAVCGWFMQHADPLLKVSIVPRSNGALGFAQFLPEEMKLYSQEAILDKIAVSLGGRAAEEIFVGKISTGASDDLDKVTKMAYSMVTVYGMNPKLGLLSYNPQQNNEQFYKPYSEETAQSIDREAREIVDGQYDRVKKLLEEKKEYLLRMADALAEKETLVYNDLKDLLGDRPYALKEQYDKYVSASGQNPFQPEEAKPAEEAETASEPAAPVSAPSA
mmetsp:Transcript_41813/g.94033  ORF Transcript_41813/g.94033 Transcript_41813/m.94033 type:complete len:796 (+) Transcript_41813:62-2449(+)